MASCVISILYYTVANILCIRKPATGGLPGRRRSPLYFTYNTSILYLQYTSYIIHIIYLYFCGHHGLGTNTPTHIVKTPAFFQTPLLKAVLGDLGRLSCLALATESSPHSADRSSAAVLQPGGFSAAGLKKASLDGPLTRAPREQ